MHIRSSAINNKKTIDNMIKIRFISNLNPDNQGDITQYLIMRPREINYTKVNMPASSTTIISERRNSTGFTLNVLLTCNDLLTFFYNSYSRDNTLQRFIIRVKYTYIE